MALVLKDRVQEAATPNTTVSFTLTGAVSGFQSFSTIGNGNTTYYTAVDINGNWEAGVGTYSSSGPTLTRTTVLSSSNSNNPVTFSSAVNLFVTYPAEKSINYDANDVATIGSTLSYSDTGIIGSFASTTAGYNQVIIQNKSTATNASSNLNVSNDTSTASTGYAELGINSSTFTGTGSFNIAGASYLASASTDLTIGTYGAYNVHFVTNSSTTDAMTIFNSGGVSLGGYSDPGIGTLYANNVYLGYTTITAAGGTTVLTNASSAWQQIVGTTTQTIQLPNATTLYKGLAFTISNNSTGNVTIRDNASNLIDTTVNGGTSVLVLTNNSTSAGIWVAYSYVPSTYDFSTTTANFGSATITNATWNGNTIAATYGGTGLSSFGSANYALYSTSSSALTAGTLPVAAGGTGATTLTGYVYGNGTGAFTASTSIPSSVLTGAVSATQGGTGQTTYTTGDILYSSSTNSLAKLPIGTTGQVLTVSSGVPAWTTITAFSSGMIVMWSGSVGSIPSGWLLCNGTNGTPNLVDRFIVGAGSTYSVGATGGSANASVISHTHTAISTVTDPGHFHLYGGGQRVQAGNDNSGPYIGGGTTNYASSTSTTDITVGTSISTEGVTGTNENLPPYYALAYIMKA